MAFLAALAGFSMVAAFLLVLGTRLSISLADLYYGSLILIMPCPVLPAITSLSLGEFPAHSRLGAWKGRLQRGIFLTAKVVFIMLVVYCGMLILACNCVTFPPAVFLLFYGMLGGYTVALRWALNDQRGRCPVCLHLLTQPVALGARSRCFLGLNGTGLMCPQGHGFFHVPESPTSWFSTQRWLCLDSSYRGLS
jgi:hypothetical protein